LAYTDVLSQDLADGMVVAASLPMTINMVLVLTKSSDGDEAAAIFNAAASNLVGVFLSPVLILGYLGVTGDIDLVEVLQVLRVVVPVIAGRLKK
jgi:sodium/bile acid cotransporter 7